jgi:hypothetical protein
MAKDVNRIVSAVLHIRDASQDLEDISPELSMILLQAADALISENNISLEDVKEMDDLAKEISGS